MFNLDKIIQHHISRQRSHDNQQEAYALSSSRPKKKPRLSGRLSPVLTVRFQEKHGTPKCIHLNALLDSGTSGSMVEAQFAKKLRQKANKDTNWNTGAGNFTTTAVAKTRMQFPQLSDTMTMTVNMHVTKSISPRYDMIIGCDMMQELGIMLDFKDGLIRWNHMQVAMTDMDNLPTYNDYHFATGIKEPKVAAEAVARVSQILDAKYAPVTPEQILDNSAHLTDAQKRSLKPILYKHIKLFDGTLGKWKGIQHKLELKDPKLPPFDC